MSGPVLAVEGLTVRHGAVEAVHELSFEVGPGEIVGLIGPNGAGKSSTLHAVMGLVRRAAGSVKLGGAELSGRRPEDVARSGIALVPEGRRIFAELTVEENLRLGLSGRRAGARGGGLDAVYDLFPVVHEMRRRTAGTLSGGQQQQLAIARALASAPSLLVLDEPTEGIQPSIIKEIGRVIRMLADVGLSVGGSQERMAIVLVEQYYDFAAELADRYLVMERGEVVQRGRGADMQAEGVRSRMSI